ncbi:MAG: dephospho-CoA kinase [Pseudomonadales bacterium]
MADFVVGITGGIGSGKTAVSDRFATQGIDVVDADLASRAVVEPGQPALVSIAEHFGEHLISEDGSLNRRALRDIVFADPAQRRWLEQLTHPLINQYLIDHLRAAGSPYAILASPLLAETGQSRYCQRVLVVDVPVEIQIERTVARDASSAEQVRAIIDAQITREERLAMADDVIVNDQDLEHLDREVARLHEQYLAMAQQVHGE